MDLLEKEDSDRFLETVRVPFLSDMGCEAVARIPDRLLTEVSMTTQVEAIYQNGIFKPLHEVQLPDNQRVRLNVQTIEALDMRNWLEEVQQMRQRIIAQRGYFPDSGLDIAEDRRR